MGSSYKRPSSEKEGEERGVPEPKTNIDLCHEFTNEKEKESEEQPSQED